MNPALAPAARPDPGTPEATEDSTLKGSSCGLYALQLLAADPLAPGRLRGRIEHVLSGRRHDFDSGEALLACLASEQRLEQRS
jgi:hypothetical protein